MNEKIREQKHWHLYAQPELIPSAVVFAPLLLILIAAFTIA